MDYVSEAKKFLWRAKDACQPEEKSAHLKVAEWCLSKAMEESAIADPNMSNSLTKA
jgi:hypothetical protein